MYSLRLACEPGPNQQDQQLIAYMTLVSHTVFPPAPLTPQKATLVALYYSNPGFLGNSIPLPCFQKMRLSEAFSFSNHHHLKQQEFLFFSGQCTKPPPCSLNGQFLWLNLLPFVMKLRLLHKSTLFSHLKQLNSTTLPSEKNFK